jgi:hypothetical protein
MKQRGKILFLVLALAFILISLSNFSQAGTLKVTEEHPFLVNGQWISAEQLKVGDVIQTLEGKNVTIINLEDIQNNYDFSVYNLEVENYSNFVIGNDGLIVHNSLQETRMVKSNNPKRIALLNTKPPIPNIGNYFSTGAPKKTMWHYTWAEDAAAIKDGKYFLPTMGAGQEGVYITDIPPWKINKFFMQLHGELWPAYKSGELVAIKMEIPKDLMGSSWKKTFTSKNTFFIKGSKDVGFNFDGLDIGSLDIIPLNKAKLGVGYGIYSLGEPFTKIVIVSGIVVHGTLQLKKIILPIDEKDAYKKNNPLP